MIQNRKLYLIYWISTGRPKFKFENCGSTQETDKLRKKSPCLINICNNLFKKILFNKYYYSAFVISHFLPLYVILLKMLAVLNILTTFD